MSQNRLPRVAEKWLYNRPHDPREYWITYVDDRYIHLTDAKTGDELSPYPVETWIEAKAWEFIERDEDSFCPICEDNLKAEDDYLCEECRFGEA